MPGCSLDHASTAYLSGCHVPCTSTPARPKETLAYRHWVQRASALCRMDIKRSISSRCAWHTVRIAVVSQPFELPSVITAGLLWRQLLD